MANHRSAYVVAIPFVEEETHGGVVSQLSGEEANPRDDGEESRLCVGEEAKGGDEGESQPCDAVASLLCGEQEGNHPFCAVVVIRVALEV